MEVNGKAVWGGGLKKEVYFFDKKWQIMMDNIELGATLAVCDGKLVAVGGLTNNNSKKVTMWSEGRWLHMPEMLLGCRKSCVVGVSGGLVVMGGFGDGKRDLNVVQVFDGETQTWHYGPSLPKKCSAMSAVMHGDLVFLMGGVGMNGAVWCANINDLVSPL